MEKRFRRQVLLKDYCTYRIGGPAAFFFEPGRIEEFQEAVAWAEKQGLPWVVLGKGSNVLISDKGVAGLVLSTAGRFTNFEISGSRISAECGADFNAFIEGCCKAGFSGLERLCDIPGTVGGAVFMNAGAFERSISDCILEVISLDGQGVLRKRPCADLHFGYRSSIFRENREIILSAVFQLGREAPEALLSIMQQTLARRNEKQPSDRAQSCGSVFKRPPGGFAGTLIEQAGLKGKRINGARISEKHANFIINDGNAAAADVRALIETVRETVQRNAGVLLEPEVIFLGEF